MRETTLPKCLAGLGLCGTFDAPFSLAGSSSKLIIENSKVFTCKDISTVDKVKEIFHNIPSDEMMKDLLDCDEGGYLNAEASRHTVSVPLESRLTLKFVSYAPLQSCHQLHPKMRMLNLCDDDRTLVTTVFDTSVCEQKEFYRETIKLVLVVQKICVNFTAARSLERGKVYLL